MLLMTSGNSVWFVFVCREYCQAFVSLCTWFVTLAVLAKQ